MKILLLHKASFTYADLKFFLERSGHEVTVLHYAFPDKYHDDTFCERFRAMLVDGGYDTALSVNFFPLAALVCRDLGMPYISWVYDSPMASESEEYMGFGTNRIYLFDRAEAKYYRERGFGNILHLPLAVNVERLDGLRFPEGQRERYRSDVSFVGRLYQSSLDVLLYSADDYVRGYLEGAVQAQLQLYGAYLLDGLVTEEIVEAVNESFQKIGQTWTRLYRRGLAFELAKEVTHFERTTLLSVLGERCDVRWYGRELEEIPGVRCCGPADYWTETPAVFRQSRLNLNPTLRCIQSGIPLRALDVCGSGGVLMSNYQEELAEAFRDGESVILYASLEEAVEKAAFYLGHGELLPAIAQKGREIVRRDFRYEDRVRVLMGSG